MYKTMKIFRTGSFYTTLTLGVLIAALLLPILAEAGSRERCDQCLQANQQSCSDSCPVGDLPIKRLGCLKKCQRDSAQKCAVACEREPLDKRTRCNSDCLEDRCKDI